MTSRIDIIGQNGPTGDHYECEHGIPFHEECEKCNEEIAKLMEDADD